MSGFVRAPPGGHLTTFYSYKGGVGRTSLLANVAHLLARWGRRVLCLDWDLEAPGLKQYIEGGSWDGPGVVDLLHGSVDGAVADWRAVVRPVPGPWGPGGCLHFIDAGAHLRDRPAYIAQVRALDFDALSRRGLNLALEALRADWLDEYDHVLIDSRTGITDVGGICAAQLPDLLVLCVNPNAQSLEGAARLAGMAQQLRSSLPVTRGGFRVLPVPCKVTVGLEASLEAAWDQRFRDVMGPLLAPALPADPKGALLRALHPQLKLRWQARWAHGEELPVREERLDDFNLVSWGLANIAALVDTQLLHLHALIDADLPRPEGGPRSRGELLRALCPAPEGLEPPAVRAEARRRALISRMESGPAVDVVEELPAQMAEEMALLGDVSPELLAAMLRLRERLVAAGELWLAYTVLSWSIHRSAEHDRRPGRGLADLRTDALVKDVVALGDQIRSAPTVAAPPEVAAGEGSGAGSGFGRPAELYGRLVNELRSHLGPTHVQVSMAEELHAYLLFGRGDVDAALVALVRAVRGFARAFGPAAPLSADAAEKAAGLAARLGRELPADVRALCRTPADEGSEGQPAAR